MKTDAAPRSRAVQESVEGEAESLVDLRGWSGDGVAWIDGCVVTAGGDAVTLRTAVDFIRS